MINDLLDLSTIPIMSLSIIVILLVVSIFVSQLCRFMVAFMELIIMIYHGISAVIKRISYAIKHHRGK